MKATGNFAACQNVDPKNRLARPPCPPAERGCFRCRITISTTIPTSPVHAKNSVTHSYGGK